MSTIGLVGSLLLTFSGVPELVRTMKSGKCFMGWGFLFMWFVGVLLCTFYSISLNEIPLIVNYSFNLLVSGLMGFYKFKEIEISSFSKAGVAEWLRQQSPKLYGRKS